MGHNQKVPQRWIYSKLIMERGLALAAGSNSNWNHPRHEIFAKIWFKFALLWNQVSKAWWWNISAVLCQTKNLNLNFKVTLVFNQWNIVGGCLNIWNRIPFPSSCGCYQNVCLIKARHLPTNVDKIFVSLGIKSPATWPTCPFKWQNDQKEVDVPYNIWKGNKTCWWPKITFVQ